LQTGSLTIGDATFRWFFAMEGPLFSVSLTAGCTNDETVTGLVVGAIFSLTAFSTLNLLSNAELETTVRELRAMAAAAIIGFSRPAAAIGTPTEL
jgi:hypothetical protein